jgi:hypothetical protein
MKNFYYGIDLMDVLVMSLPHQSMALKQAYRTKMAATGTTMAALYVARKAQPPKKAWPEHPTERKPWSGTSANGASRAKAGTVHSKTTRARAAPTVKCWREQNQKKTVQVRNSKMLHQWGKIPFFLFHFLLSFLSSLSHFLLSAHVGNNGWNQLRKHYYKSYVSLSAWAAATMAAVAGKSSLVLVPFIFSILINDLLSFSPFIVIYFFSNTFRLAQPE